MLLAPPNQGSQRQTLTKNDPVLRDQISIMLDVIVLPAAIIAEIDEASEHSIDTAVTAMGGIIIRP